MNSRFVSVLLVLCVARSTAAQSARPTDSLVSAKALNAVRQFQNTWRREWMAGLVTQRGRMNQMPRDATVTVSNRLMPGDEFNPRFLDLRCYFRSDVKWVPRADHAWGIDAIQRKIPSQTNSSYWTCPNWLPPDNYYLSQAGLKDEGVSIDNALERSSQKTIHDVRAALILELATAVNRNPADSVLVGQYIRMLVDNNELPKAMAVADNCRARASWCRALKGFVAHRLGQIFDAEDSYLSSLDALRSDERCAWDNLSVLLNDEERAAYEKWSCAKRDSTNQVVWWLADPLWSIPGNDRFVEQFTRNVTIALHSALGRDERYNWTPSGGADALAEMIKRYGWMSYVYSDGSTMHFTQPEVYASQRQIDEYRKARALGGVRSTYEYSLGRVHVVPPMTMVNAPFDITNDDWSMNAPGGDLDFSFNWWPVEHYAPPFPLVKLVDQQTGFLRRQDSTLLAFATNLARTDLARKLGDSVTAIALAATGPRAIRRIAEKRVRAQDRLTFLSAIPIGPSLISVEVPWRLKGERAGRSRFGVKPPGPLSTMRPGEIAISDPLILTVPANADALPNLADSAIALMYGSTTLAAGADNLGVFWETYGIAAGDSVEISISVQQRGGAGSPVVTSWREPQPAHAVRTMAGTVPIQMRSVVLQAGALPIGTYTLEISVQRRATIVRSSREFTIR